MRVSRQVIKRWFKKLFDSSSARQFEPNMAEVPLPSFGIGERVKVIATAENSARRGKIREHVWHHKNTEWMYFINEGQRKVSKRYWEDELAADHENFPAGPSSDVISKKLTSSGSLVEAHELLLDIEFTEGKRRQIVNPLGTEFDLADIFIGHSKEQLDCSPFVHSWSNEVFGKFSGRKGIWLSANSENLFLEFANAEKYVALDTGWTLFFPILDEMQRLSSQIVCMRLQSRLRDRIWRMI